MVLYFCSYPACVSGGKLLCQLYLAEFEFVRQVSGSSGFCHDSRKDEVACILLDWISTSVSFVLLF